MSGSNFCFLTCVQISQEADQMVWYSHLLKNFPQFIVIHTVKGFGIVSKAEIDVFLELSCFFDDPMDVGNLISGSSAFSKSSLNIWKFPVHVLLKPGLENSEHYLASVWEECSCAAVWTLFGTAFLTGVNWQCAHSQRSLARTSRHQGQPCHSKPWAITIFSYLWQNGKFFHKAYTQEKKSIVRELFRYRGSLY